MPQHLSAISGALRLHACVPQPYIAELHTVSVLLQVLSKGNILCFPEARQAAEEQGSGQPHDVGPLLQAVACTVVSTRGPAAAATAAREGAVQSEGNRKDGQHVDEECSGCATHLSKHPVQGLEPQQSVASVKRHEQSNGQGANHMSYLLCYEHTHAQLSCTGSIAQDRAADDDPYRDLSTPSSYCRWGCTR